MTDLRYSEAPYDAASDVLRPIEITDHNGRRLIVRESRIFGDEYAVYLEALDAGGAASAWLTFDQFDKVAVYVAALKRERGEA